MIIFHITLTNWRNFKEVEVPLNDRILVVGPNAGGKSNFLEPVQNLLRRRDRNAKTTI